MGAKRPRSLEIQGAFILKTVLASTDEIMLFSYYPYYEIASSYNKTIFLGKSIEEKRIFKVIHREID